MLWVYHAVKGKGDPASSMKLGDTLGEEQHHPVSRILFVHSCTACLRMKKMVEKLTSKVIGESNEKNHENHLLNFCYWDFVTETARTSPEFGPREYVKEHFSFMFFWSLFQVYCSLFGKRLKIQSKDYILISDEPKEMGFPSRNIASIVRETRNVSEGKVKVQRFLERICSWCCVWRYTKNFIL